MCFTIGFCAACALSIYWLPAWLLPVLAVPMLGVFGALIWNKIKSLRVAAVICLGCAAALLWCAAYDGLFLKDTRALDGQVVELTLEATDFSFDTDYGICVDGKAELGGRSCRVRMYVNQWEPLSPGDRISGSFRLRYTAPGGSEDATHHSSKGIFLLAYPKGEQKIEQGQERSLRYVPAYLRKALEGLIEDAFPADAIAFVKALLMGNTSELDYSTESNLTVSGIRHVAAVSGLHVSILFSMAYLLLGRRGWLPFLLGTPLLLLFAAMAGFSPSVMRAALMQVLILLSIALRREYDPPTSIAFAALVMLVVNPLTVTSVGFQLSIASVSGIFLFSERIKRWLMHWRRLGRWKKNKQAHIRASRLASSVSISLSALIATTPLTAWYFGNVSLFSAVTNLLCLWVVTLLFCGIVVACVLTAIWLPLGKLAGWLLAWPVRYILGVAGLVAKIPMASVYTESIYIVAWLILCYVLLAVFLKSKEKQPLILSMCVVLSLCVALLASWTEPLLDDYRVTLVDVGQGQCVLLQSGGKTYMVDCGGSYNPTAADKAAATLLSQGVTRLDGLILTHYDKDHVGAAEMLLHRIPADVLILPDAEDNGKWTDGILSQHTGRVFYAKRDMILDWEQGRITVYPSIFHKTSNESSLCVLFHTENCDILITGDRSSEGEAMLLMQAEIPKLDALVVGHHGASSATSQLLLEQTTPATALISVGEGNAYGHPSQTVLDRLQSIGCRIRRTDLEGTIIYRG
jgi:competence protein ComEC